MTERSPDAFVFPTSERPEQAEKVTSARVPQPDDDTLDQGIAESFPASDPVSVTVTEPPSPAPRTRAPKAGVEDRAAWRWPAPVALASSAVIGLGAVAWWAYGAWQRSHSPRRRLARFGLR
ncbi:hypothetical protein DBA29_14255 [Xenophilus aerolatus]|nr:hypothetical protein [Xenophilus aerolatus]